MTEQEYHDLLIRLDARQSEMKITIDRRLEKIESLLAGRMCHTHAEKIRTLEKITWGAVLIAMGAIIRSFWSVITGGGH